MNSFYVVFRIKKHQVVDERSEDSGNIASPQDDTVITGNEKSSSKSPEVHEARIAIVQRVTL
jgi:hypothetical protein